MSAMSLPFFCPFESMSVGEEHKVRSPGISLLNRVGTRTCPEAEVPPQCKPLYQAKDAMLQQAFVCLFIPRRLVMLLHLQMEPPQAGQCHRQGRAR